MSNQPETNDVLSKAELCGQCQMEPCDAAMLCGVDRMSGELEERYKKGALEAQLAVRKALLQKAKDGDGSAQKEFLRLEQMIDVIK